MKTQDATENPLVGRGGGNANKLQSSISKRRNVMKASQSSVRFAGRAGVVFLTLLALVNFSFGQGKFKNGGTLTNNSSMTVPIFQNYNGANAGTLTNTSTLTVNATTGTTFDNNNASSAVNNNALGTIDVTGTSSTYANGAGATVNNTASSMIKLAGAITNGAGTITTTNGTFEYKSTSPQTLATVVGNTYGNLIITGAATKTLGGNTIIGTLVTINNAATLEVGSGNILTLNGASPFTLNGTGALDATTGASAPEVIYNGSAAQAVLGTSYVKLTIQNGNSKNAGGNVVLTGAASVLSVAALTTFDLQTYSLTTAATTTITNNNIIRTAGNVSFGAAHTIANTFEYYASAGTQSLGRAAYANLTLSAGAGVNGLKQFPSTVSVSGTYTVSGANRDYATNSNAFTYNGVGGQTVQADGYYDLTIASSAAVANTASAALAVTHNLTINSGSVLDMAGYSTSTWGAGSTNSGKIQWSGNNVHLAGTSGITELYGSGAGALANGAYGQVLISGGASGTPKTIAGGSTSAGPALGTGTQLSVASGAFLGVSGTLTVNGDVDNLGTITNSGSITVI